MRLTAYKYCRALYFIYNTQFYRGLTQTLILGGIGIWPTKYHFWAFALSLWIKKFLLIPYRGLYNVQQHFMQI